MSMRTSRDAKLLSVSATFLSLLCMLPPVIVGAAAKTWGEEGSSSSMLNDTTVVLPTLIETETPSAVALVSLAAIR
jgi:hypothetical protein